MKAMVAGDPDAALPTRIGMLILYIAFKTDFASPLESPIHGMATKATAVAFTLMPTARTTPAQSQFCQLRRFGKFPDFRDSLTADSQISVRSNTDPEKSGALQSKNTSNAPNTNDKEPGRTLSRHCLVVAFRPCPRRQFSGTLILLLRNLRPSEVFASIKISGVTNRHKG